MLKTLFLDRYYYFTGEKKKKGNGISERLNDYRRGGKIIFLYFSKILFETPIIKD